MESIREVTQKIKQKIKMGMMFPPSDLLIVAIIVLVGFAGFGLGRLSVINTQKTSVAIIGEASQIASVGAVADVLGSKGDLEKGSGEVVASKNGSKYHYPWCSGAQRIVEKNLISFSSIEKARKAGYTAALNCKGLE